MYLNSNLKLLITNIDKFARDNNINRRTLQSAIYNDKPNPTLETLIKISKGLNISIDDLLYKDFTKEQEQNEH